MPGAAACKVLDDVCVLYTWDRPDLFSPLKSARKSDLRLGNTVFLVTRLPSSMADLQAYLGINVNQSRIKPKQVMESLLSKREALIAAATARVLSHFSVDEIYLPSTPRQALAVVLVDATVVA